MKTLVFLANLLIICSAEVLKSEESVSRPLLKPSGKPLVSSAALVDARPPNFEYISSEPRDEVKPTFDYISAPNVEQTPTVEYISRRPSSIDYISSYPSLESTYNSYAYSPYRYTYATPQRGYQTGYQYIRPQTIAEQRVEQRPLLTSYPLRQSYYPYQRAYQPLYQTQYQYQYYPRYLSQWAQPLSTYALGTYLPIIPLKKKK